jgi:hypothetical protein
VCCLCRYVFVRLVSEKEFRRGGAHSWTRRLVCSQERGHRERQAGKAGRQEMHSVGRQAASVPARPFARVRVVLAFGVLLALSFPLHAQPSLALAAAFEIHVSTPVRALWSTHVGVSWIG